jgi:flagellar biosynthetic protein FliO
MILRPFALALWQNDLGTASSLFWTMAQTFGALFFVIILAVVVLRVVLPRLNSVTGAGASMMRVVDRLPVSPTHSLCVIEVAGRWLVVGLSSSGVQFISELDPVSAETAEAEIDTRRLDKSPIGELGQAAWDKIAQTLKKEGKK